MTDSDLRQRQNKWWEMHWAPGNGMDCGESSLMVCCLLIKQIMVNLEMFVGVKK